MTERAVANEKIQFVTPAVVEEILAPTKGLVEGVRLRNPDTNEMAELALEGVFVAIGHNPNTAGFRGELGMDPNRDFNSVNGRKTKGPGVYVGGDVQGHR